MEKTGSNIQEKNKSAIKSPGKYSVVFHNDDFTPMDFVVFILMNIFLKDYNESERLMLKVHIEGYATVGTYSYDIAVTKASKATGLARANGYPLRITVRPS